MKQNIKKSIKYLLFFTLLGTLCLIYLLPNISEPTFERVVGFYVTNYLFILSGSFSLWWITPNVDISIRIIATVIGLLSLMVWAYMIKKNIYPFWKILIPIVIWVMAGWFFLFTGIILSI